MNSVIIIESDDEERNGSSQLDEIQTDGNKPQNINGRYKVTATTRRRPRKSVLMTKPNPDVHFETVAMDNNTLVEDDQLLFDDSNIVSNESVQQLSKINPNTYVKKRTKPNHITDQLASNSISDVTNAAYEDFLASSEVKDLINTIGEERARINYMLTSTNMPEIDFQLYTPPERIQLQFEDRLKHINN